MASDAERIEMSSLARLFAQIRLADPQTPIPGMIHGAMRFLVEEIRLLELRIGQRIRRSSSGSNMPVADSQLEREQAELAKHSPACTTLLSIPGVGLLTATAMVAATGGQVAHFKDARHFASWFGLTPREFSSGNRVPGRISKRGGRYLRMLLTHGATSSVGRLQQGSRSPSS